MCRSRKRVVFTSGKFEVPAELRAELTAANVQIEERRALGFRIEGNELAAVQLEDGTEVRRQVMFVRPPQRQTPLVQRLVDGLGLRLDAPDLVHTLQYETSIPGLIAAGDLMMRQHGALPAAAAGASAAHALDEGLTHELVVAGVF